MKLEMECARAAVILDRANFLLAFHSANCWDFNVLSLVCNFIFICFTYQLSSFFSLLATQCNYHFLFFLLNGIGNSEKFGEECILLNDGKFSILMY